MSRLEKREYLWRYLPGPVELDALERPLGGDGGGAGPDKWEKSIESIDQWEESIESIKQSEPGICYLSSMSAISPK